MVDGNFETDYAEVFVGNYTGEYIEEEKSVAAVWEIEKEISGNHGDTCTMKLNKDNDSEYRFRHFRTGRLLSFKKV